MKVVALVALAATLSHVGTATDARESESEGTRPRRFSPLHTISSTLEIAEKIVDMCRSIGIFPEDPRDKFNNILRQVSRVNERIDDLEKTINGLPIKSILNMLRKMPLALQKIIKENQLEDMLNQIDIAHDEYASFVDNAQTEAKRKMPAESNAVTYLGEEGGDGVAATNADKFTILKFATWATGPESDSVKSLLARMHKIVVSGQRFPQSGIFDLYGEYQKEKSMELCNEKFSPQQVLFKLYQAVFAADYKGYVMLQFSYAILKLNDKGDFAEEKAREERKFKKRSQERLDAVRNVLANADRSIYKCDPQQYVEGVNFVKLTKLVQGYIENEVNLNPDRGCWDNCNYYQYTEYHGCYKDQFCGKQKPCRGKVIDCKFVQSDMTICVSSNPERRYDWVEYEKGGVAGNKGRCRTRNLHNVDSWWRYLFWHCSYCYCLCDDGDPTSDRFFNLRPVVSDIEDNKVITGVKIVKHNGIIHLQIQQGKLTGRGLIKKEEVLWKPVDNYKISDPGVEKDVDYHEMSWLERSLDIDELAAPADHALTGIKIRKVGNHLNLEIMATPFNFTTGQLASRDSSLWIGNDNTELSGENPRKEIVLTNPDIPIRNGPHFVDGSHNEYLKFQATSFWTDVSQETVPYFDSEPVTSRGLLSGFGLVHRGKHGSGGFVAPKLISFDFTPYV